MMACLLSEIRTNREEMRAGQEHLKEKMLAKMEMNQERMEATQGKMFAKIDAHHERMMARMDYQLKKMEACLEKMESTEEIESEAEHEEVCKEEAAVETWSITGAVNRDQHLDVRRHG
jgi:hypothetical protein